MGKSQTVPVTGRKANLPYKLETKDIGTQTSGEPFLMEQAVNADGKYIGTKEDVERMIDKWGINRFEVTHPDNNVCSIGFNKKEQKWYGWSHRAWNNFGIGDVVKKGDCAASSGYTEEYLLEHPEENRALPIGFTAKTIEDAKRMAIAFADSVS